MRRDRVCAVFVRAVLSAAVSGGLLAAPARAGAQDPRLFENSWFWGIHGGAMSVQTPVQRGATAGVVGAEWFITRRVGGVYAAYDQSHFARVSAVTDSGAGGAQRFVDVRDMRSVSLGALAFPFRLAALRPYAGLGFSLGMVGSATVRSDTSGATSSSSLATTVQDARSRATVFALGGAQWQVRRVAVFGQAMLLPPASDFLLSGQTTMFTAGVRYNFGSSIDRGTSLDR